MFKGITIKLSEPICSCDEQSLQWGIATDSDGNCGLYILCKHCKTKLEVPHSKFTASWSLDKSYPGKKPTLPPKAKLEVMDGGKVIEFEKTSEVNPETE